MKETTTTTEIAREIWETGFGSPDDLDQLAEAGAPIPDDHLFEDDIDIERFNYWLADFLGESY